MTETVGNPDEDRLRAQGIAIRDFAIEAYEKKWEGQRMELGRIKQELEENCVAVWDFAYVDGVGGRQACEDGVEVGTEVGGAKVKGEEKLWKDWFGKSGENGAGGNRRGL